MFATDVHRIISMRNFKDDKNARNLTRVFEDLDSFNYESKYSVWMSLFVSYFTVTERAQHTTNRKKTPVNYENNLINLTTHKLQMLTKKHAANTVIYLVVLWAFAVRFFICLHCEHLQQLLFNWWRYFLDLLALFLFACFLKLQRVELSRPPYLLHT